MEDAALGVVLEAGDVERVDDRDPVAVVQGGDEARAAGDVRARVRAAPSARSRAFTTSSMPSRETMELDRHLASSASRTRDNDAFASGARSRKATTERIASPRRLRPVILNSSFTTEESVNDAIFERERRGGGGRARDAARAEVRAEAREDGPRRRAETVAGASAEGNSAFEISSRSVVSVRPERGTRGRWRRCRCSKRSLPEEGHSSGARDGAARRRARGSALRPARGGAEHPRGARPGPLRARAPTAASKENASVPSAGSPLLAKFRALQTDVAEQDKVVAALRGMLRRGGAPDAAIDACIDKALFPGVDPPRREEAPPSRTPSRPARPGNSSCARSARSGPSATPPR